MDNQSLKDAEIGEVAYTDHQKKEIFDGVEALMLTAGIPVRDTWKSWNGDNLDDILANNMQSGGPRSIRFIKREDGKAEFTPLQKVELPGYKSYSYEKSCIYIPEHLVGKMHPLVHEVTHFLQHDGPAETPWFPLAEPTEKAYLKWVSQRSELEAHFVQLLYIDAHELNITDEKLKVEFKDRLAEALKDTNKRPAFIVYAKDNGIL